jgi:nucleoside-diphosphate-sugar epimerase
VVVVMPMTMMAGAAGGVSTRVARIFNTFGPRMHPNDGRVVSNFIIQVGCTAI